jgi:hypothetical protein
VGERKADQTLPLSIPANTKQFACPNSLPQTVCLSKVNFGNLGLGLSKLLAAQAVFANSVKDFMA